MRQQHFLGDGCAGDCGQGDRACDCQRGMWDDETERPWLYGALYAAVFAAAVIASIFEALA